jgi:hypothetical protein
MSQATSGTSGDASGTEPTDVHVLYLAGSGRSGSTLVTTILGQLPGFFAAGELRYLWSRGATEDHVCGCGQPFSRCPVWTAVMEGTDPAGRADAAGIGRRLLQRLRMARLPALAARRVLGRPAVPAHPDDVVIASMYRALAEHTGARVVVDSSKLPPYGLLLSGLPGVRVSVLHVVRDPRATAFSWMRQKVSRDRDDDALMPRQQPVKSSLLWLVWNLLTAAAWPPGRSAARIRYEDFVTAPREVLAPLVRDLGADPDDLPFVDDRTVRLSPTHAVAGNPNRRDSGPVRLKPDLEWQSAMRPATRLLVTAVTVPGLLRFGYPVLRRGARPATPTPGPTPTPRSAS